MTTVLPTERESTPQPEHGYALGQLSEYEYTVLSGRLAELRNESYPFAS